jgi:hypothetical protein
MNRHLLLAAAAALLAACAAKDSKPAPQADPPFVFPHSPHVENDVDCKACHASIVKSTKLEARVRHVALPKKNGDACNGCHDDKDFKEKLKLAIPARRRPFDLRFDHAAHLAKAGVTCVGCHKAPPELGQVEPSRLEMSACTACHKHQADFQAGRCTPCHVDLKKYEKPVAAFQHAGDFLKLHGNLARPTAESCAACHDQTYCADCHSGATVAQRQSILFPEAVQRDFIHRGDYQSRHMIDAGANPASCRKCHGSAFCDSCHTQRNLSPSPSGLASPVNPHPDPAVWANNKASGNFHGTAARKNIVACAACHDNGSDSTCVGCHRVGGLASVSSGNPDGPHPSSFVSKHRGEDRTKRAMCMACHVN